VTERIGTYEIRRLLARGGMSVVFLVRQPALDREAVLKQLNLESHDPSLAQRFVDEARLAAALSHPNIVTLFDFFEYGGVPYIAMEYVAGGSLRPLVGALGLPQVFGVLEGVLSGLEHAERRGVVHRDLKPENVLLSARGTVKIADFGIARAYSALQARLTSTGTTMGTPMYMAPEQATDGPLGAYTDLYAVGVIAYELLAGRPPFRLDAPLAVLYCHVHQPPPPLADLVTGLPGSMCDWVHRLLAKQPSSRPQSAGEAWETLEEIAVGELGPYWRREAALAPGAAMVVEDERPSRPPSPPTRELPTRVTSEPPPGDRRARPHRVVVVGAVAALLAAGGLVAVLTSGTLRRAARGDAPAPGGRAAMPYDFDRDGRAETVIALPDGKRRGDRIHGGVVLVHERRRRSGPPWTVLTEAAAGVPPPAVATDAFGTALASGDFDADGRSDLAVGAPGRDHVSVLYGSAGGLLSGRRQQLAGARAAREGRSFGYAAIARDLDGDGFADLVVTARTADHSAPGSGALELVFGGPRGLRPASARMVSAPTQVTDFGRRIRSGDIDRDGHVDLVEGAIEGRTGDGHLSFCPGAPRGPVECRPVDNAGGTSSLAVADVNGDGFADIVQGDAGDAGDGGEVRLWPGGRRGPARTPLRITQTTRRVPGLDDPGDGFGATVETGDIDSDGYADIIVGAPGEDDGAGSIVVVRGGRAGIAATGHTAFDQDSPGVPGASAAGHAFGDSLALLRLSGGRRPDLVVAAPGARPEEDRILVIASGPGMFAPGERRTSLLGGVERGVRASAGARIRIGHAETG
jgi:hypothetical protein